MFWEWGCGGTNCKTLEFSYIKLQDVFFFRPSPEKRVRCDAGYMFQIHTYFLLVVFRP